MDKKDNHQSLKQYCASQGLDLFGVAELAPVKHEMLFPPEELAKFDKAVSLGVRLQQSVFEELKVEPNRLYSHHYKTANTFLDNATFIVAHHIQEKGFRALPIPASQILDWEKQTAHCSHKKVGYLAGLGWIGRNNLLVNERLGAQFRLSTILTDMPLSVDEPVTSGCGECRLCIEVCPAQAIKEDPRDFGHRTCFEKLKEFSKKRLVEQYICGVCANVCRGKVR